MWKLLAKFCAWMYVQESPKRSRNKRRVEIDALISNSWDPSCKKGLGNRDFYTIELSQWLKERKDRVTIDELVEFIFTPRQYVERAKARLGAKGRTAVRR